MGGWADASDVNLIYGTISSPLSTLGHSLKMHQSIQRSIAEQYGASRTVRGGDSRGYYSSESVEGMEVAEGLLPLASQWLAPLMG